MTHSLEALIAKVVSYESNNRRDPVENQFGRQEIFDIIREDRDIQKNKDNMCVFNFPDNNNDKEDFLQLCIQKLGIPENEISIVEALRVGQGSEQRPLKPLIVKLNSRDLKSKILGNAKKLKNYKPNNSTLKVYISPDLTRKQREDQKILTDELRTRRANREEVMIKDNKIIPKPRNENSDNH